MIQWLNDFATTESGSSGVEYGLLALFFVAIVMVVAQFFGDSLSSVQGNVAAALTTAAEDK